MGIWNDYSQSLGEDHITLFGSEQGALHCPVARVLIDQLGGREFDYLIPGNRVEDFPVGSRVRVPFGGRRALGTIMRIHETAEVSIDRMKEIEAVLSDTPELPPGLMKLAEWIAAYYCCPLDIAVRTMLPQPVRKGEMGHKTILTIRLQDAFHKIGEEELGKIERRAPKQAAILEYLSHGEGLATLTELNAEFGSCGAAVKALEKAGWIASERVEMTRDPHRGETVLPSRPLELNDEQQQAVDRMKQRFEAGEGGKPILLFGVTGSGKTEVYLQALAACLSAGKGAIVLVPEIALTPQTVDRFRARFVEAGIGIAVLHSHLSAGERHDEWHRIRRKEVQIVIGVRSAIFAPVDPLGLIVVDEEHESSYKQEETPRYQARDLAVVRGQNEKAVVVLGSATPSFESYRNALAGKYDLVRLSKRVDQQMMPLIRVVDMRMERVRQKGFVALSEKLLEAMRKRLAKREQIILFLNRRGYAASLTCPACGQVCGCPHCSVALTWHRKAGRLSCHFCDHAEIVPAKCPFCGQPGLRDVGMGTERVEESLGKLLPGASIRRMDADTMTRRGAYRETFDQFRRGEIDILLGTQMIAKGLHFPNVTLVGIVNADLGLNLPDFRAGERTFQLLTQVSGRAGRGEMEGEVIVQTFNPSNPSLQFARQHDFEGYYETEFSMRERYNYPPCTHLISILIRSAKPELAKLTGETLAAALSKAALPPDATVGEAQPAPVERIAGETRYQIILRSCAILTLSRLVQDVIEHLTFPKEVRINVDVDAYSVL